LMVSNIASDLYEFYPHRSIYFSWSISYCFYTSLGWLLVQLLNLTILARLMPVDDGGERGATDIIGVIFFVYLLFTWDKRECEGVGQILGYYYYKHSKLMLLWLFDRSRCSSDTVVDPQQWFLSQAC